MEGGSGNNPTQCNNEIKSPVLSAHSEFFLGGGGGKPCP